MPILDTKPATAVIRSEYWLRAACAACPHPVEQHDVIALRFCAATTAGGFDRGCVCGTGQIKPDKEKSVNMDTTTKAAHTSRYDQRLKLARDVLKENRKLSDADCQELAVRLLHAVDTVPEKLR